MRAFFCLFFALHACVFFSMLIHEDRIGTNYGQLLFLVPVTKESSQKMGF